VLKSCPWAELCTRSCRPHQYFWVKFSCSRVPPHRQDGLLEFSISHPLIFVVYCSHFAAHVQGSLWCRPDPKFTGTFGIAWMLLRALILRCPIVCGLLQWEVDKALVSSDQKTRGFVVQIILPRRFFERAHQMLGEMLVRYVSFFDLIFVVNLACGLASTVLCFCCGA
jgi:hypothetical protein